MRPTPAHIWDVWDSGRFFGDEGAPHGRVTVEPGWKLDKRKAPIGTYPANKMPIRWYQRADNSQVETEVPNIVSINIDRSIDNDAATCVIVIQNTKMDPNNVHSNLLELGRPGYYTWSRGSNPDANARWNQVPNEWAGVLVPNALIRTYQGYGGRGKTMQAALVDGNIILTGVWLVDDVRINAGNNTIELRCRDMGKLLIEQQLFPPLVPGGRYPLRYCRWITKDYHRDRIPHGSVLGVEETGFFKVATSYDTSSGDVRAGAVNAPIHGHRPSDAFETNLETFWLSPGNVTGDAPEVLEWIQANVGGAIDAVHLRPWDGYYMAYISVMEGGVWQTDDFTGGTIDYTGATYTPASVEIPYVMRVPLMLEAGDSFKLPRSYRAQKVRVTLTGLAYTQWGPDRYRGGLREFIAGNLGTQPVRRIRGADAHGDDGYWMAASDGGIFAYGNVGFFGSQGALPLNGPGVGIAGTHTGAGYWLAAADGGIFAFGDAPFYGSFVDPSIPAPLVEIEARKSGGYGFTAVTTEGHVYAKGTATHHGNAAATNVVGIAVRPQNDGYWIVNASGQVYAHGGATHYGNAAVTNAVGIECHPDGLGYYIVTADGGLYTFGSAVYRGNMIDNPDPAFDSLNDPMTDLAITPDGGGYWMFAEDGGVFAFGNAEFWGAMPGEFDRTTKIPGNYSDYADIIKDLLLWSGWWLYEAAPTGTEPSVYGNIEETGIFSEECLPEDLFDKKPVIDAITAIKEVVGFIFWIDEEGAANFTIPNWWEAGNDTPTGERTETVPEIDERRTLTDYSVQHSDAALRSEIIISSSDPTKDLASTITTRYAVPMEGFDLRGMVKPAMWINEVFTNKDEQRIMAALIALHIWFSTRTGSVTMPANPCVQINDQVRIWERQTSETYIHYVRGYSSQMDLKAGTYEMTLQTNWLGDETDWAITGEELLRVVPV